MKVRIFRGLYLAVVLGSMGLSGCGGGGIDEGMPPPGQPEMKLDPKMVDMGGRSFGDQKKSAAKNQAAKNAAPAPAPPEKTE